MKYYTVTLLICALLASSTVLAEEQSTSNTIKLGLFEGSNSHWIAINVQDGSLDTTAVQMRDSAADAAWVDMDFVDGWVHWISNSHNEYTFPLSFRITSKAEQEIVIDNIISALGAQVVDTGVQYSVPRSDAKRKSSHGRVTKAPTTAPTKAPTKAASTKAPSTPTTTPITPTTGNMGLLVPLYTSPGSTWDTVIASASLVKTVAIINPDSGPGNGPDSSYKTYMKKMQTAGVDLIGYVHTSYGARALADVKADIDKYASEFPQVVGIFIDECASTANQVAYYTTVNQYIMSMPGYKYNVLNPGTVPTSGYFAISTQIVAFESSTSQFANSANPSFANASNKNHFAVIGYSASQSAMVSGVAAAKNKGYYGWAYFIDTAGTGNTYNSLPSYYAAMASAVAAA